MECTRQSVTTPLRRAPTIQEGFLPPPTNRDLRGPKVPQLQEVLVYIIFVTMSANACSCSTFKAGEKCFFYKGNLLLLRLSLHTTPDVNGYIQGPDNESSVSKCEWAS